MPVDQHKDQACYKYMMVKVNDRALTGVSYLEMSTGRACNRVGFHEDMKARTCVPHEFLHPNLTTEEWEAEEWKNEFEKQLDRIFEEIGQQEPWSVRRMFATRAFWKADGTSYR